MIYLDAATTPPPLPEALLAAREAQERCWGDPAGLGEASERAAHTVEEARGRIADLVEADPEGVILCSGGTEADNLALKGLCAAAPESRRHLAISSIEPYAVNHPARSLERRGWKVTHLGVDPLGRVIPAFPRDAFLVSVVLAHPGVGTWQDLRPLAELAHARGALFHADACAAAGFDRVSMRGLGGDALSLSGHHLGAPSGAGALVLRSGVTIRPLIEGGTHEGGLRPGMPALGPVAGMGAAAESLRRELPSRAASLRRLGHRLMEGMGSLPGAVLTGDPVRRIPGHASCCLPGLDGEALVSALASEGILASTGSPCAQHASEARKAEPSLLAMGIGESLARGSLRLSASAGTAEADVDKAIEALGRCVRRLRALAPAGSSP